jgi:hypothetical protein
MGNVQKNRDRCYPMFETAGPEPRLVLDPVGAAFRRNGKTAVVLTQEAVEARFGFETVQIFAGMQFLVVIMQLENIIPWRQNRKVPCWPELIELVQYAHASAFSDQVVIGWDVALLDSGPCIMEANKAPDLDILQRAGGGPLGNQRLGKLLAFNLRRTVEARHAPGTFPPAAQKRIDSRLEQERQTLIA